MAMTMALAIKMRMGPCHGLTAIFMATAMRIATAMVVATAAAMAMATIKSMGYTRNVPIRIQSLAINLRKNKFT